MEYFHHQDLADLIISIGDGTSLRSFGVFKAALKAVSNKLVTAIVELEGIKLEHINAPSGLPTVALPNDDARAFSLVLAILSTNSRSWLRSLRAVIAWPWLSCASIRSPQVGFILSHVVVDDFQMDPIWWHSRLDYE